MNERRVYAPTPEDSARWRKAVEEELRAKPENIARAKRLREALAEQTLAGQLRRAIVESRLRTAELAHRAEVARDALDAFLLAESPLDSDAFGRVASVLKYELSRRTATS